MKLSILCIHFDNIHVLSRKLTQLALQCYFFECLVENAFTPDADVPIWPCTILPRLIWGLPCVLSFCHDVLCFVLVSRIFLQRAGVRFPPAKF